MAKLNWEKSNAKSAVNQQGEAKTHSRGQYIPKRLTPKQLRKLESLGYDISDIDYNKAIYLYSVFKSLK